MAEENVIYTELDPKIEYIKIHGLQRSGTNYLAHLIDENFKKTKALVNLGGWKHGAYSAPWYLGKEVHVAVIVKNPYSWLASCYRYWGPGKKLRIGPSLDGVSFDHFVRNRCYFERQRDVPFLFRASNPVQHWNNMNFHWMSIRMNAKRLFVIAYEKLVEDNEKILNAMQEHLNLERSNADLVGCDKTFKPAGEKAKPTDEKWDKSYYANAEYMKMYSQDLLDFVNEELDMDIMVKLAYNYAKEVPE